MWRALCLGVGVLNLAGCALVSGQYACENSSNCPSDMVCTAGACQVGTDSPDAGDADAGAREDAGPGLDAGPPEDAGVDAGPGADAGPGLDAGPIDAAPPVDAGPCTGLVNQPGNSTISLPGDIAALAPDNNQCLRVAQRLQIVDTGLTNLDGLEFVVEIGRDLVITGNANLTSIEGLSGLTLVEEDVLIENNPNLRLCDVEDLLANVTVSGMTTLTNLAPCP